MIIRVDQPDLLHARVVHEHEPPSRRKHRARAQQAAAPVVVPLVGRAEEEVVHCVGGVGVGWRSKQLDAGVYKIKVWFPGAWARSR